MRPPTLDLAPVKQDRAARRVVARWRSLTGGGGTPDADRRTLVACSGGADSTALALALAGASEAVVVGHVVHDLRPEEETLAERDSVRGLASDLAVPFTEASVAVRAMPGNAESNARRERYAALERMAFGAGCPFVATAHHANDQLETMLMALLRGAGPRGLAGMPARRALGGRGVRLVRPMLGIGRPDAERICACAGVEFASDPSNADVSRLRAALRAGPAPELARLRPGGLAAAAESAETLRQVADLLDALAAGVVERADATRGEFEWAREALRGEHPALLAAALRLAHERLHGGRHRDKLPGRAVREAVAAIRGRGGEQRRFVWRACELVVDAERVVLRRCEYG